MSIHIHTYVLQVKESLIDASAVNPALLEILAEAEKLQRQAEKTEKAARNRLRRRVFNKWGEEAQDRDWNEEEEEEGEPDQVLDIAITNATDNAVNDNASTIGNTTNTGVGLGLGGPTNNEMDLTHRTKAEAARILDVSESSATVSMHVTGLGVRAFHFTKVCNVDRTLEGFASFLLVS